MPIEPPSADELARRGLAPDGMPLKAAPKAKAKAKAPAKKKPAATSGATKPKLTENKK